MPFQSSFDYNSIRADATRQIEKILRSPQFREVSIQGSVLIDLRTSDSSDHNESKRRIVEYFKSYRLV